jgi:hypothetical protein
MKLCEFLENTSKNLYSIKLENPKEIDKFLDTYSLLKLNEEDIITLTDL